MLPLFRQDPPRAQTLRAFVAPPHQRCLRCPPFDPILHPQHHNLHHRKIKALYSSTTNDSYILLDGDLGIEKAHEAVLRPGQHEGPLLRVEAHLRRQAKPSRASRIEHKLFLAIKKTLRSFVRSRGDTCIAMGIVQGVRLELRQAPYRVRVVVAQRLIVQYVLSCSGA